MINKELQKRILSSVFLIPVSFFFIIQGSYTFIFFLSLIFLVTGSEWFKMTKNKDLLRIFGLFFLFFSFFSSVYLRQYIGLNFFLFLITVCIFTDIGGYFFGKTIKGPKLTKISPKKTISGFVGGFLLPLLIFYLLIKGEFVSFNNQILTENFLSFIFFIITISFISQIGDIAVSYFKRLSGIKNSGNIIPGHGGILDRIDGMIFVFLISYFLYLK